MQPTADFCHREPPVLPGHRNPAAPWPSDLDEHDTMATEPAVVVNEAFAEKFFPGEDPIGARLRAQTGTWITASWSGSPANARQTSLAVQPQATLFLAQAQGPMYSGALVVRTSIEPAAMARAVENAVHAVDPDQAISDPETFEQVVAQSVARPRLAVLLLGESSRGSHYSLPR